MPRDEAVHFSRPYSDFPAGKAAAATIITPVRAGPKFGPLSSGDLTLSWEIRPVGGDASGGNNFSSHKIIVCGTSTTDPRCKK